MKQYLKIRDIERLENTSIAGALGLVAGGSELMDATEDCVTPMGGWTNGCQVCIDDTECCDVMGVANLIPAAEAR